MKERVKKRFFKYFLYIDSDGYIDVGDGYIRGCWTRNVLMTAFKCW